MSEGNRGIASAPLLPDQSRDFSLSLPPESMNPRSSGKINARRGLCRHKKHAVFAAPSREIDNDNGDMWAVRLALRTRRPRRRGTIDLRRFTRSFPSAERWERQNGPAPCGWLSLIEASRAEAVEFSSTGREISVPGLTCFTANARLIRSRARAPYNLLYSRARAKDPFSFSARLFRVLIPD